MRSLARTPLVLVALFAAPALAQTELLPDIIVRESDLYDHDIVTDIIPGHTHLRLSNGTANVGAGRLYLYGGAIFPDNTREVIQRVFLDDGTWYDRVAGRFVYHPEHGHIHFEEWALYSLREVLPGDGVGQIVAKGAKTSFCILDLGVYDSSLPGYDPAGEFHSCGTTVQGLSVGWIDVYSKGLAGQNIDITGVPDGEYWLESTVDPNNDVLEGDESNNVTRIKITIGTPNPIPPDAYEPDDSVGETSARPEGGPNSPNLGPTDPVTVVPNLTVEASGDADFYRFYMPASGTASDFVRIDFTHANGDLDMHLLDAGGATLATSDSTSNAEQISMDARPAGWYFVEVYGYNGATNPDYTLTIDPSANGTPSVGVTDPGTGNAMRLHGTENYTLSWSHADPEANETWVSVYANTAPAFDGNEFLLPTSLNTPGDQGFYVINSAYLPHGRVWFYAQITDGGSSSGAWSNGTLTFSECPGDITTAGAGSGDPGYGVPDDAVTAADLNFYVNWWVVSDPGADITTQGAGPGDPGFDIPDGAVTASDLNEFVNRWVTGCP